MKKYIYLFLIVLFTACGKDDDKLTQTCQDFPQSPSDFGYNIIDKPGAVFYPSFNPNNSQELCFGRNITMPDGNFKVELWKANIVTGQQQKLADEFWGQPDWGKNGWILFEKPGNQIYKVKSNGDSLTHLPFNKISYNPKWNNATGEVLHNIGDHPTSNLVKRNADGWGIEFIPVLRTYRFALSPDGRKLVSAGSGAGKDLFLLFDFPSLNETLLRETDAPKGEGVIGKAWHPDNVHVFWTSLQGLFKTNVITKQTWQLKTGCDSRIYHFLSISPDGQSIAVTRYDLKLVEDNTIEQEHNIYLMDINGNNERKLEL